MTDMTDATTPTTAATPGSTGDGRGLRIEALTAGYGRFAVLNGINLSVAPGEVVGVLGANGAGKSTLMKVISGLLPVRSGTVTFEGATLARSAAKRVAGGVVLVAEGHEVVRTLTVEENLKLGTIPFWPRHARRVWVENRDYVHDLFPILLQRRNQLAGLLSGGEQQMLAIARAIMAKPRLLLLDEPSLGLAPVVVERIYETLSTLRSTDLSILLVEQNADTAARFCDRVHVMRLGELVMEATGPEIDHHALREAYFGV